MGQTSPASLVKFAIWEEVNPLGVPDGKNIAYAAGEIFIINPDGTDRQMLTDTYWAENDHPAWSPDGSKIAFESWRDGNLEIYVMNSDGTNQINLTNNPTSDFDPCWSPDGSKIIFYRDGAVWMMNSDGTLSTSLAVGSDASWSPDGSKIVFVSNTAIWMMNSDGKNQTQLSKLNEYPGNPRFSPDGTKIAWTGNPSANIDIYVIDSDGTNRLKLTNQGFNSGNSWSPF